MEAITVTPHVTSPLPIIPTVPAIAWITASDDASPFLSSNGASTSGHHSVSNSAEKVAPAVDRRELSPTTFISGSKHRRAPGSISRQMETKISATRAAPAIAGPAATYRSSSVQAPIVTGEDAVKNRRRREAGKRGEFEKC